MNIKLPWNARTLALVGVLVPLLALFLYVGLRSGPLAPIPVTVTTVEELSISPALYGLGTVEARYIYKVGPTTAGRVKAVGVQVGDMVKAGQLLAEMDPVDLDERVSAQMSSLKRAEANVLAADAQVQDVVARRAYAQSQAQRYEALLRDHTVSAEAAEQKSQELQVASASLAAARANLDAAKQELERVRDEGAGLIQQRANLRLVAPVDGLVVAREANPGTTLVAGQSVVELIDPTQLWISVRFDQLQAAGLQSRLGARIVLRSRAGEALSGEVLRVEPLADAVTEEMLAKVVFNELPQPLPPLGELAEVTIVLPERAKGPSVPNAGIKRIDGRLGVMVVDAGALRFRPVTVGATDLEGRTQILEGLSAGERVVVYSQRAVSERSRIKVVERLPSAKT
ncbi:MAG: efflux RND transporter periplasmic adaptor subunit [Proteobacteria bacterium]|nr:MAG: efflux RND transporter periplasmic adaptor subunit [Pseudomonadota bacterium]QKK10861.1 MAG: efflux RND transporter periplasmic adaptor subunit [Pseudomonadota bacterium]